MKAYFKYINILCIFLNALLGQQFCIAQNLKNDYARKMILKNKTIYCVKKANNDNYVARLYFFDEKTGKTGWNSTHSGKLYQGYSWDIDGDFWTGETSFKYGPQLEQHYQSITFLTKREWLEINEFDTISSYVKERLSKKELLSTQEYNFLQVEVYSPSTYKHCISENFNSISTFYRRLRFSRFPNSVHHDWALMSNRTILMPILFEDTLHLYRFKNKAWHSPNYQGIEANRANDKWTKEKSIPVEKQFDDQFRYFSIQDESYFVANADTCIYKLDGQRIRRIGTIKKKINQDLNYLLDKDTNKLYFIHALSLDVEEEERSRFAILRPEDPLYVAVQKLIAAKEDPELHKGGK